MSLLPELPSKHYVVWVGRAPGIYDNWDDAKAQVHKFPGARYKSFPNLAAAKEAYASDRPAGASVKNAIQAPLNRGEARKEITARKSIVDKSVGVSVEREYETAIYCDGACEPNPGNAGSGVAVYRDGKLVEAWLGHYKPDGTNNYAELSALLEALIMAERELEAGRTVAIACDSTYAINAITVWAIKWQANGWEKKGGPIKNLDLIKDAYKTYLKLESRVEIVHVRSHTGIEGNEVADRMAMKAVNSRIVEFEALSEPLDVRTILEMPSG